MALLIQIPLGGEIPADSVAKLRREARRAEATFERLSRALAPLDWGSSGQECDEIVGRFCLTYDDGDTREPEPEAVAVVDARRAAIEALRLAFSYQPDRLDTSGPLVRYLIEDDRASEAVSAARTYASLSEDDVWGPLLLGFALHAATEDTAAERLFGSALERLPEEDARHIRDVHWQLSRGDRGVYGDADAPSRERMERLLWRFADPLYMTPGNEHWAEHVSRHVWSRILEMMPSVRGALPWGRDLEQLTVRYGVPTARTRTWGLTGFDGSIIEHYDPDQLAFFPADILARGLPPQPLPGEAWALGEPRSRTGFAARTFRRLIDLPHQITRFPSAEGTTVRVDARLVLDSVAAGRSQVQTGLWLLRDGLDEVASARGRTVAAGDTAWIRHEATVPAGHYVYSLEAFEVGTRLAGRARYAIDVHAPAGLRVSDPLVALPFSAAPVPDHRAHTALRPHALLVFRAGETVGLYAEVDGLTRDPTGISRYRVELSIRKAGDASLPARVVSWLGRTLRLSSPTPPPRLSWEASGPARGPAALAVDVRLEDLDSGMHELRLLVTDLVSGARSESRRILRIEG